VFWDGLCFEKQTRSDLCVTALHIRSGRGGDGVIAGGMHAAVVREHLFLKMT